MELFNYGLGIVEIDKFNKPTMVDRFNNKIDGGLWLCPKTELYSNWVVMTLYVPNLVRDENLFGNTIILKDDVKMANIDKENYLDFMYGDSLDLDKCSEYDVLHFNENLIEVKEFEAYYFESYQVLNFDCIKTIIVEKLDVKKVTSKEYILKSRLIFDKAMKHLQTTEVFKAFKDLME